MTPDLRLIRYFVAVAVAVADTGNVTRAAQRLHISQPSMSAAIQRLEAQLGVQLLARQGRRVTVTPAGTLMHRRGRELLDAADALVAEVRDRGGATSARLRLGVSRTARYGIAPRLLSACAAAAPAVMLNTSEDTTGALLGDVANGALDLAIVFCAPAGAPDGVELTLLHEEPAIVHLPAGHRPSTRSSLRLCDLVDETILIAASRYSSGYTDRVLSAFDDLGLRPRRLADPYPDNLWLQSVRDGLGIVIYARSAYPEPLVGSVFIALEPALLMPFHLARRKGAESAALRVVVAVARALGPPPEIAHAPPDTATGT
jgi:DNA-binding transcriptional LysR family regulator